MKPKILKPKLLFIIYLFLISIQVLAQREFKPGYIITKGNDTIFGFIDNKSAMASLRTCLFKKSLGHEVKSYTAEDINGYRFDNGRYFISYRLLGIDSSKSIFYEYLIKGRLEIFRAKDQNSITLYAKKDSTIIVLDNNERQYTDEYNGLYLTRSNKYIGQLLYLTSDQPILNNEIQKFSVLSSKNLIKLSKKYHQLSCPDQTCIEYAKSAKSIWLKLGLSATYGIPYLYLDSYGIPYPIGAYINKWDFTNHYFYKIGLPIELNFKDFNRKLSLLLHPGLSKTHLASDFSWSEFSSIYRNKIEFDFVSLHIPISVKYSFNSASWKVWPNLGLGIQSSLLINPKASFYFMRNFGGSIDEGIKTNFEFSKFQNSLFATIGLDVPLKKNKVSLNVTYELGDGIHKLKFADSFRKVSKTSMISITTAYYF